MTLEFNGENFEAKDIKSNNGMKREIVRLVNAAPAPDRECETTDFLMCLQAIIDRHIQIEATKVLESAIEELPVSPFYEFDLAKLIQQKVEYTAWSGDDFSIHHDVDYSEFSEELIELLKKHML